MSVHEKSVDDAILAAPFAPAGGIVVAVSGGADSVVLLDALHHVNVEYARGWTLRIAHINHRLRGEESEADAEFVRRLAEEKDLAIDVVAVDTTKYARSHGLSIEAAAREQRYAALEAARARSGADSIAVAHTRDDQTETVLLHLARGSGLRGMAAMRVRSGRIVRPFLSLRRSTIRAVLHARALRHREDRSNLDLAHARNRLRNDVVPRLEAVYPGAVDAVARAAELLGQDSAYISQEVQRVLPLLAARFGPSAVSASAPVWRALHPALQGHVLHTLLGAVLGHHRDIGEIHVELVARTIRSGLHATVRGQLPEGLSLICTPRDFTLTTDAALPVPSVPDGTLTVPGSLALPFGRLTATLLSENDLESLRESIAVAGRLHLFADLERLGSELLVRTRKPGDRMRPLGLGGSRKLQDILVDAKIPRAMRDQIPVIENGAHIVWLVGVAADERVAPTAQSARFAHVRYAPDS